MIDEKIQAYVTTATHIRNTCFHITEGDWSEGTFQAIERFTTINRLLFDWVVLKSVGIETEIERIFQVPIPRLHVIPKPGIKVDLLVHRPSEDNVWYWDALREQITSDDHIALTFKEFFDWKDTGNVKLEYVRGVINRFDTHPEFIGRYSMIPRDAAVFKVVQITSIG